MWSKFKPKGSLKVLTMKANARVYIDSSTIWNWFDFFLYIVYEFILNCIAIETVGQEQFSALFDLLRAYTKDQNGKLYEQTD